MFRKLLLTLMIIGALGSAVGAGTYATFTASVLNPPSTFSTGSVVLSNQKGSATACFSTAGLSTDSNLNAGCDVMFSAATAGDATSRRPGEGASVLMNLRNEGSLASTLSVSSAGACTLTAPTDQTSVGSGDACSVVQLSIQEGTTCYWGDNMGTSTTPPFITGAPLTYPLTITSSDNRFKLTVDGVVRDNLQLTAGTYNTAAAFVAEVNARIGTWATASAASNGALRITSKTATAGSNVSLGIPSTNPASTGLSAMGFIDGSNAPAPGVCATKTGDTEHTLAAFRTATATTPLALGALATSTTRPFTVQVSVPAVIGDQMQGRKVNFDLTWTLTA